MKRSAVKQGKSGVTEKEVFGHRLGYFELSFVEKSKDSAEAAVDFTSWGVKLRSDARICDTYNCDRLC